METFKIEIQEFLSKIVELEANNIDEALSIVEEDYKKCVYVLDYNDFVDVNFINLYEQSKKDRKDELTKEIINYLFKDEEIHYGGFEENERPKDNIFLKLKELKKLLDE